jgi:hypothetical protein
MMCALGALIPDERYTPDMDDSAKCGGHMTGVTENHLVRNVLADLGHELELCEELQNLHDECDVDMWEAVASDIAERHGLKYTAPPEVPA